MRAGPRGARRARLIMRAQAARLEGVFKVLANDTRLRLLHALVRAGQLCVTEPGRAVGLRPQAVSNQLQRLVDRGIWPPGGTGPDLVPDHRSVRGELLDLAWCLTEAASRHLAGARDRRHRRGGQLVRDRYRAGGGPAWTAPGTSPGLLGALPGGEGSSAGRRRDRRDRHDGRVP